MRFRIWALGVLLAAACSAPSDRGAIARIAIQPKEIALLEGGGHPLEVRAWDGEGKAIEAISVSWSSDDPEIATVSEEGVVEGHTQGETLVRAAVASLFAEAKIRVERAIDLEIELKHGEIPSPLKRGVELRIEAQALGSDKGRLHGVPFHWSVSDPSVIEIRHIDNDTCFLRAVGLGQATLRVASGLAAAELDLRVEAIPEWLEVQVPGSLYAGERWRLRGRVLDDQREPIEGLDIEWISLHPEVLAIEGDELVALSPGNASIKGSAPGLTSIWRVEVLPVLIDLKLSPAAREALVGDWVNFDIWLLTESGPTLVFVPLIVDPPDALEEDPPMSYLVAREGEIRVRAEYEHLSSEAVIHAWGVGTFDSIQAGGEAICGLNGKGTIYCYVAKMVGGSWTRLGVFDSPVVALESTEIFDSFAMGNDHLCALTKEGRAFCYGMNTKGQLGTGKLTPADTLVPVATELRFKKIFAGNGYTCAISLAEESDNTYCWGDGGAGKLGNGSTAGSNKPTAVQGFRFETLALSRTHPFNASATCGIDEEGQVLCWGANDSGQLGNGTLESSLTPVPALLEGRFVDLSIASWIGDLGGETLRRGHACALREDRKLFCWGDNRSGQVAPRAEDHLSTPEEIEGLRFEQVAVGTSGALGVSCGITDSGEALCWGSGEVGYGLPEGYSLEPTPIRSLGMKFRTLDVWAERMSALRVDGKAYYWGSLAPGLPLREGPLLLRGQYPY